MNATRRSNQSACGLWPLYYIHKRLTSTPATSPDYISWPITDGMCLCIGVRCRKHWRGHEAWMAPLRQARLSVNDCNLHNEAPSLVMQLNHWPWGWFQSPGVSNYSRKEGTRPILTTSVPSCHSILCMLRMPYHEPISWLSPGKTPLSRP
jgi:hypothetical protein